MQIEADVRIEQGLGQIGYGPSLVAHNVTLMKDSLERPEPTTISMAAYWGTPFDQFRSAVAVVSANTQQNIKPLLRQLVETLWTPYALVARPSIVEVWDGLPQGSDLKDGPKLIAEAKYGSIGATLQRLASSLAPTVLETRKRNARQLALYELGGEEAFQEWAFRPSKQRMERLLHQVLDTVVSDFTSQATTEDRLRMALRLFAVRVALDKGWVAGDRTSAAELAAFALRYPSPWRISPAIANEIAREFVLNFSSMNLAAADAGLISHVVQTHGLLEGLRKKWKLYPTPPDLAWRMLERLPLERIVRERPTIWDGTCGTGTLLVAALDRLRALGVQNAETLNAMLRGNEKEPLLADLTHIALDTAYGALNPKGWGITTGDVNEILKEGGVHPDVIVGNPPFKATGSSGDEATEIVTKYLKTLPDAGMISIVLPRAVLASAGKGAIGMRKLLLTEFVIENVEDLPEGFAIGAGSPGAIISARRRLPYETEAQAVIWEFLPDHRKEQAPLVSVLADQNAWAIPPFFSFEPPIKIQLSEELRSFKRLHDYSPDVVGRQGMIPERPLVGSERPSGKQFKPYLAGLSDLTPFFPANKNLRWINPESAEFFRNRPKAWPIFEAPKLLITRKPPGGSSWPVRATSDNSGVYPSDDFIVIRPGPFSLDLLAGLFNSLLINAWIRWSNPSRMIRVEACLDIPVPEPKSQSTRKVESIAKELKELWSRKSSGGVSLQRLVEGTLDLDDAVFDLFGVSNETRLALGEYYQWRAKNRPGFQEPCIRIPKVQDIKAERWGPTDRARLRELLDAAQAGTLSDQEKSTLHNLLGRWESVSLQTARKGTSPSGMFL